MKLIHLTPPKDGFLIDGSSEYYCVPAIVEDDNNWYAMILDSSDGTYHFEKFKDRRAVFLFSAHNFEKIEDDELFYAIDKFLHDSGTGAFVDGQRHTHTGSLSKNVY